MLKKLKVLTVFKEAIIYAIYVNQIALINLMHYHHQPFFSFRQDCSIVCPWTNLLRLIINVLLFYAFIENTMRGGGGGGREEE